MKKSFLFISLLFILAIGCVSAADVDLDNNLTDDCDESIVCQENIDEQLHLSDESDEIIVNNWDELQYYCSLKDDDYTLRLKENTNYYPTNPDDSNYQIKVYNNVKIIGSEGAYFGDKSSEASTIKYTAIVVPDNYKSSICLENVTFKWISDNPGRSDGIFLQMGGQITSTLKNCYFERVNVDGGHATIVYLKKGTATLENCTFIKCTSNYGCVSVYDPNTVKNIKMAVRDCYFESNYARTAPGCINNCGILEIYNSTFYRNSAHWWAGAVHTHSGGRTTIYDSNFTDNVAGWNGGALYTYSYLNIYNTVFSGNNCTTNSGGGAIGACAYQSNPHIYIENCLFEKNANNCWSADELSSDAGAGGAIAIMDEGSIIVLNTTFISNVAAYGSAISAHAAGEYGSPNVIIANNSFINHTVTETLSVGVSGSSAVIEGNYFEGNYVIFRDLSLTTLSSGKDSATLQVNAALSNPGYYDKDIYDKMNYNVYINNEYVKTVNSTVFDIDFDDLDICDVYVIPSISNRKSNVVTVASTREYIFVSKKSGDDNNDGLSRDTPVNTISKALELAGSCQSILLMDGEYGEGNLNVNFDLIIKGENNATLTNLTSFNVDTDQFTFRNLNIFNINSGIFVSQSGNLTIDNCIFKSNSVVNLVNAKNTNIFKSTFSNNIAGSLVTANDIVISKSIFLNNDGCLVYNNGFSYIKNSILLDNTKVIDGNLDNINLDYNWWGNTLNNLSKPNDLINNWLILNATSSTNILEQSKSAVINVAFYLFKDSQYSLYDDLRSIIFDISTINGTSSQSTASHNSKIVYTLIETGNGVLTISYNNIKFDMDFEFIQSKPNISIKSTKIMSGEDITIQVTTPSDATGNITLKMGLTTLTREISGSNTVFSFRVNNAGDYTIIANYTGDSKYQAEVKESPVTVSKRNSSCVISVGEVVVGEDVIVKVTTSDDTTGRVVINVNGESETLILNNQQVTYTIKSVTRGDYLIHATYQGNTRYLPCESSYLLEVDNINSSIQVVAEDITYGDVAIFIVKLNDNATGNVSVSVNGVMNTSAVINGSAVVYLSGLHAGYNQEAVVLYSGDNTYFNLTILSYINVLKANFTFNISSSDIKIGQDAVINIQVPAKTGGNFTINGVVLIIPMSGEVSYTVSDLAVGNYTFTAIYEGNDYNTVSNSTSFCVFEYSISQWSNDGADTYNTQKSQYAAGQSYNVDWISEMNSTINGNLVIDSEGNIYVATIEGIYSFYSNGTFKWFYESNALEGNFSGLALGRDVALSPRTGDRLYFINQYTGEVYGTSNIYQASSMYPVVIDSNATVYAVSEYQYETSSYNLVLVSYKLWENGGDPVLVSLNNVKPLSSPCVSDDIIVVLGENQLRVFDANSLNTIFIKNGNFNNIRPIIGEGNVVYATLSDSVVAYSISGSQLWKTEINGGLGNQLLLDNEIGVYTTNSKGNLFRYDIFTGEETLISDLCITSGILIDGNHNLYFASNNIFYGIAPEGSVLWKSDLGSNITGTPVMNKDGVIYVTSKDNKFFALSDVTLIDPGLEVTVSDIVEGEDAVITIKINSQTTGNLSFTLNNIVYSFETSNGTIVKVIPNLSAGTYIVNVTYPGDLRFNSTSKSATFTVKAFASLTTQASGSAVTFTLPSDATGTLTIKVNGQTYTKTLTNGKATITLADGTYDAVVTYEGNSKYAGFSKTVKVSVKNPVQPVKTVKKASKIVAKKKTFKAKTKTKKYTVTLKSGKTPIKNVKLIIKIKKKTYKATTNSKGKATFKIKKLTKKGRYTAVIKFNGNKNYKPASKKIKIIVK